jgi:membrane-bound lytic murein transglycosylase A
VQGSGRVNLAEGGVLSLSYDGSNNRPYTAIGNVLIEQGILEKDDASWPRIRDWLKRHPQQAREVMRRNERYIFFQDSKSPSASGAEGVTLTAQRSLAVDLSITPFGTPIWIDTVRPMARKPGSTEPYRRLTIVQDTGTAIQGPARGDVFFGGGPQAADWAGRMNSEGRAIVLVPNRS